MSGPGEYQRTSVRLNRRSLISRPGFLAGLLLAAAPWLMIGVLDAVWARFMTDLGAGPLMIGVGFLSLALPSIFVTPISGRIADRMNPVKLAFIAAVVELPLVMFFGWAASIATLLTAGALHSTCWSFVTPPGQAAVAKAAPPGQAAEAQGLVEAYGLVLASVGAFAASPIYGAAGPSVPVFGHRGGHGGYAAGGARAAEQAAGIVLRIAVQGQRGKKTGTSTTRSAKTTTVRGVPTRT